VVEVETKRPWRLICLQPIGPHGQCRSKWHLERATAAARKRYERRRAATDWFHAYWHTKWEKSPVLSARVTFGVASGVPQLASSPRRDRHILYEDCLYLEDQAALLLIRLEHHPMLRRGVDIRSTKTE
jgi:hypothetical protein